MMKKIISLILVVCFLLSCFVVSTSAETSDTALDAESNLVLSETVAENINKTIENTTKIKTFDSIEYVNFTSNYKTHYAKSDALAFQIDLSPVGEYDNAKTFFSSTENIILTDYKPKEYNSTVGLKNLNVTFDINSSIISKVPLLNFKEISFEKIYVATKTYAEGENVENDSVTFSILPTAQGVFMSEYGDIYAYDHYISYLYSNGIITDAEYKLAVRKATELIEVDVENPEIPTVNQPKLRVYNEKNNAVELQSDFTMQEISAISGESNTRASQIVAGESIMAPSVAISRTIEALDSGQRLRVFGEVYWEDIYGEWHPAKDVKVQILDDNSLIDETLATLYTLSDGSFSAVFDNQLGGSENGYDIYLKVNTKNENFEITTDWADSFFTGGYFFTTGTTNNVTSSHEQLNYASYNSDTARSMSIHQALIVGYYYYETMNNFNTNDIVVYFPSAPIPSLGEVSYATPERNTINIISNDYCDWDVIIHELGHHAAAKINVNATFGKQHSSLENLSERYGKSLGISGAWNEGWATYFSMAAQLYYNSTVTTISTIPNVADNIYTDLRFDGLTLTEKSFHRDFNITSGIHGITDGSEYSVISVLLYLMLDTGINLSHQEVWNICKQSGCNKFSDFMEALYNSVDKELHPRIGEYLERHNISDKPDFGTEMFSRTQPETFYWTAATVRDNYENTGYNEYTYYNQARLVFYDKNLNIIFQTENMDSTAGEDGVTLTNAVWTTLTNMIGVGEPIYWGLATYQNDYPATGPYYSTIRKYHFLEDFASIPALNTGYTHTLPEGGAHFYKFDAPETGDYIFYSEGDTDVRLTYYDSYRFRNPKIDDDSGAGLNFMYRKDVSSSTTVYLVVDSPTSDSGQYKIAVSRIKTLTNTQSGSLSGTYGNWYQFTAPYTGTYHFVSPANESTYGELFSYPTTDGSTANRLAYSGTPIGSYSFKLTYALTEGQTVYLRVRGQNASSTNSLTVSYYLTLSDLGNTITTRLDRGQYFVYEFVAPFDGNFTFYTEGYPDTYADVFNAFVYDRTTTTGRIAYDDNSGDQNNCSVTCALTQGQVVYVRIRGYSSATSGMIDFGVIGVTDISANSAIDATVIAGQGRWYAFTAPVSGTYIFYTLGSTDTHGTLFSAYSYDLTTYKITSDDDGGASINFRISHEMSAGEKVYIYVRGYGPGTAGAYTIYVE